MAQTLRMHQEKPGGNMVSEEPGGQAWPASVYLLGPSCCISLGTVHPTQVGTPLPPGVMMAGQLEPVWSGPGPGYPWLPTVGLQVLYLQDLTFTLKEEKEQKL